MPKYTEGKLLKLKRISLDLDQQTLADLAEVSQQTISLLESDSTSGARTLDKVWHVLNNYEEDQEE